MNKLTLQLFSRFLSLALSLALSAAGCSKHSNEEPDVGGPDQSASGSPQSFAYTWDFGTKAMYYDGTMSDPMLTGVDPMTGMWRCKRDDTNSTVTDPSILRMAEPNDSPDLSVSLSNPLPADLPPTSMGSAYEICPDRSEPTRPDQDVFKFKLSSPAAVMAELKYQVALGDLDVALFIDTLDPMSGVHVQQRVIADLTATDNACIQATHLQPGTYFIVVRGAPIPDKPGTYHMNTYRLRVQTVITSGAHC